MVQWANTLKKTPLKTKIKHHLIVKIKFCKNFVYNKLKFVYYMTAEDRDYLKYLKIVRDFTDQVC